MLCLGGNGSESEICQTGAASFGDENICLLKLVNEEKSVQKVN